MWEEIRRKRWKKEEISGLWKKDGTERAGSGTLCEIN